MRKVYANVNNKRIIFGLFCRLSYKKLEVEPNFFIPKKSFSKRFCLFVVELEFHILCCGSKKSKKKSPDIFPSSTFPFDTNRAVSSLLGIPQEEEGEEPNFSNSPPLFLLLLLLRKRRCDYIFFHFLCERVLRQYEGGGGGGGGGKGRISASPSH